MSDFSGPNVLAALAQSQSGCAQCLFFSAFNSLCVRYPPQWTGYEFSCPVVPVDFVCGEFQAASGAATKLLASSVQIAILASATNVTPV